MDINPGHLALRREELIARSKMQRETIVLHGHSLSNSVHSVGRTLGVFGRVVQHPSWIIGLVASLIAIKPRRVSKMMKFGIIGLKAWRMVEPAVHTMLANRQQHRAVPMLRH
jgi:hypothetical protein